ncbi:MAG: DUF4395 domain-containing protein [Actinomycetota bacterium]|nr:DUF4395 domain-containing protein [Actinomycetota bacterium]
MTATKPPALVGDCTRVQVDPRGPRFGGAVTTVILALALVLIGTPAGTVLIAWQTLVFALGAIVGLHAQPYGIFFRRVVRPRLSPPAELEDAAPPRFAQAVGLAFLVVALVASLAGVTVVATVAVAFALAAAFLNAAFGFCLGCEMYLLGRRLASR